MSWGRLQRSTCSCCTAGDRSGSGAEGRRGEGPLGKATERLGSSRVSQAVLMQCTALTLWDSMSQSRGEITQDLKEIESTVLITKNCTK